MTTRRQINKILNSYCNRSDLLVRGYEVYLIPIEHVVRGFKIYRTGEANRFNIAIFYGTSFDSTSEIPSRISSVYRFENWLPCWTDPDLQDEFERIMRQYYLPMLKLIDLGSFVPRQNARWQGPDVSMADAVHMAHMKAPVYAAFGEFGLAEEQLAVLAKIPRGDRFMEPVLKTLLDDLWPLIRNDDRAGVAALLHRWEANEMDRQRLSNHWRPAPFPLELDMRVRRS